MREDQHFPKASAGRQKVRILRGKHREHHSIQPHAQPHREASDLPAPVIASPQFPVALRVTSRQPLHHVATAWFQIAELLRLPIVADTPIALLAARKANDADEREHVAGRRRPQILFRHNESNEGESSRVGQRVESRGHQAAGQGLANLLKEDCELLRRRRRCKLGGNVRGGRLYQPRLSPVAANGDSRLLLLKDADCVEGLPQPSQRRPASNRHAELVRHRNLLDSHRQQAVQQKQQKVRNPLRSCF